MAKHVRNKVFQYTLSYSIKPYMGPTSLQACYNKILGITAGMLLPEVEKVHKDYLRPGNGCFVERFNSSLFRW